MQEKWHFITPGTGWGHKVEHLSPLRDRLSRPPGSLLSSFSQRGTRLSDTPHTRICLCLFSLFRRSGEMSPLSTNSWPNSESFTVCFTGNAASQNRRKYAKSTFRARTLDGRTLSSRFWEVFAPGGSLWHGHEAHHIGESFMARMSQCEDDVPLWRSCRCPGIPGGEKTFFWSCKKKAN